MTDTEKLDLQLTTIVRAVKAGERRGCMRCGVCGALAFYLASRASIDLRCINGCVKWKG